MRTGKVNEDTASVFLLVYKASQITPIEKETTLNNLTPSVYSLEERLVD